MGELSHKILSRDPRVRCGAGVLACGCWRRPRRALPLQILAILLLLLASAAMRAADQNALISAWLQAQTNIQSWAADFTQTRTLRSLTQPLTATGHLWFAAPNRFRWELGSPARTIAVRSKDQMLVIYPRLRRVERYPLTGNQSGEWRDVLALLEAGFPRSQAEMETRFKILSQSVSNHTCELTLQPNAAAARKMMPQIRIAFATNDFSLRATELQFADGSTMRNDFTNGVLNPKADDSLFTPKIENDYKVVEPLKK